MFTKHHQGIVKKTVLLEFENGYSIKLEKGIEMAMFLAIPEHVDCEECKGTGLIHDGIQATTCGFCGGWGKIKQTR